MGLYALALAPFVLIAWRRQLGAPAGVAMTTVILAIGFVTTGLPGTDLASTQVSHLLAADTPEDRCAETLALLRDAQVILPSSDAAALHVNGAMWERIPAQIQDIIVGCMGQASGAVPGPAGNVATEVVLH